MDKTKLKRKIKKGFATNCAMACRNAHSSSKLCNDCMVW